MPARAVDLQRVRGQVVEAVPVPQVRACESSSACKWTHSCVRFATETAGQCKVSVTAAPGITRFRLPPCVFPRPAPVCFVPTPYPFSTILGSTAALLDLRRYQAANPVSADLSCALRPLLSNTPLCASDLVPCGTAARRVYIRLNLASCHVPRISRFPLRSWLASRFSLFDPYGDFLSLSSSL
jgi:hypothetical protein